LLCIASRATATCLRTSGIGIVPLSCCELIC
jgi:hypothetical protein